MQVRIHRIDKELELPIYQTKGSVAFDLMSRIDTKVEARSLAYIPLNVVVEIPEGYMLALMSRSSFPKKKKGLIIPHGYGVIDQDYCGPNDELLLQVLNISDEVVDIVRGERLAQGVFVKIDKGEFVEIDSVDSNESRGGFGSTGGHA